MVNVKWNSERITFELPPPNTPLGVVRDAIAEYTHLPRNGFKLIHKGAILRDDNASSRLTSTYKRIGSSSCIVSAFHLKDTSTIAVVEIGSAPANAAHPTTSNVRTEQATISAIHSQMENVRSELSPAVEVLLASPEAHRLPRSKEHLRLSELLLQALLRLDGITTEGDWELARQERKSAVKEVQNLLDRLDSAGS
ncbi:unnamed protein product [Mycena citricolor]|uniref:BAG domain-containing protein n=1 Tax=Mycena citricolor TaxID=2018698 RepID=A0AAD2JWH5_9AGAR|nr:unnamed protein product [Mycena citricolor]CAK5281772.1 unnamed protein product [Mycena citricolor]